ncbi:hypothetical protein GJ700_02345 [Duganella sp. FT92W]|uniref:Uncharacterized protein n=1 Tax=Pseudoduganella rivuli TaxID=2666085 RepID=A0A7X2IIZ2_9BURK|nr:hypothetical protein [Pseudoduganella rivuli]MRV70558.1 hypothetical protein [Pseudoduganella rivuli]
MMNTSCLRAGHAAPSGIGWLAPLHQLTAHGFPVVSADRTSESDLYQEWSEEAVVRLHWRLLESIRILAEPRVPLDEKFEMLRWIFTDPARDRMPFSFVSCTEVVSRSPLSPTAYVGRVDPDEIRAWIRANLRRWLAQTLALYPSWVREAVIANPEWIASRLAKNAQWLNEQIKRHGVQNSLF